MDAKEGKVEKGKGRQWDWEVEATEKEEKQEKKEGRREMEGGITDFLSSAVM